MTPEQIATIISLLLAPQSAADSFPVIAAGGAKAAYPVKIEPCPRPLPPTEVEGKTVICGRVSVPENHDRQDSAKIDLAFSVLKARTESPAPDPVIYLHGGPGGGAVRDLANYVAEKWGGYRDRRDLVTFDQRAAGISSDMVTCFDTLAGKLPDLANPKNLTDAGIMKLLGGCTSELKTAGRDLPSYNTVQNAKDVRALMQTLGYKSYNIYGVSYGTTLGLEVMRSAPEGVRTVILDSVAPASERSFDNNILPVQEGVQAVVDQCNADTACAKAFPKLDETINRVAEKLRLNPIPASRGRPEINTATLISLFEGRNSMGSWPQTTAHIPLILSEWDRGETKTWDMLSSGATARAPSSAERLQPYQAKLTPEQRALAALLLDHAAAQSREDAAAAKALQAFSDSLEKSSEGGSSLSKRFDEAVTRSIIATGSREQMTRFLVAYASLATKTPDRAVLKSLVTDYLPDTDVAPTLALLEQLTDADVAGVFKAVSSEARGYYAPLIGVLDLMVIACQESVPFNSRAGMEQVVKGLKYPFLATSTYVDTTAYDFCPGIAPVNAYPFFHDPVKSPIPALVLYGLNDTQTSSAAARQTASELGNASAIAFPEAGHGSLLFSQCARDIGIAFVERPTEQVDSSCTANLKPKWVLPPAK